MLAVIIGISLGVIIVCAAFDIANRERRKEANKGSTFDDGF